MPRKLIPLTKKALEPVVQKILDRLIVQLHLEDCKIYYSLSKEPSDCCAKVRRRGVFKEADIIIYPKTIREVQEEGYEETLEEVLLHECLHIWIWKCFLNVDDKIVNNKQFDAAEEILVEELVRIMLHEC